MNYYIYDTFVSQKKYEKMIEKVEKKLTDLGIRGKSFRLNVLKKIDDIVDQAENDGVKNIIAIGNDQTMNKVCNALIGHDFTVGIIPIDAPNALAGALGINSAIEACEVIARRKIQTIDVGKAGDQYFILFLLSPSNDITFEFKGYSVSPLKNNELVGIYNFNIDNACPQSSPRDGIMEALFMPGKPSWWSSLLIDKENIDSNKSIFPISNVTVRHTKKPVILSIDGHGKIKTPVNVEVLKNKLKIIVGKERM